MQRDKRIIISETELEFDSNYKGGYLRSLTGLPTGILGNTISGATQPL